MSTIYLGRRELIEYARVLSDPFKKFWKHNFTTNCYAYALGLDVPADILGEDNSIHYDPGFFGKERKRLKAPFTEEELLRCVTSDLDAFNFYFKEDKGQLLNEGEWKIAIFGAITDKEDEYKDYHFLRNTGSTFWTHKQGYGEGPTNVDSKNLPIISPDSCTIAEPVEHDIFKYKYLKTLILSR